MVLDMQMGHGQLGGDGEDAVIDAYVSADGDGVDDVEGAGDVEDAVNDAYANDDGDGADDVDGAGDVEYPW